MNWTLIGIIITGVISITCTLITIVATHKISRKKFETDLQVSQATLGVRLDYIDKKLESHNNYANLFAESMPVIKEQIKNINQRLGILERKVSKL